MLWTYLQQKDEKLLAVFSMKLKNKYFDRMMPIISRMNDYGMIFVLLSLFSIRIGYRTEIATSVLMALAVGLILGEGLLKHAIKRSRPSPLIYGEELLIKLPKTSSFPSGHTTSSFAVLYILWHSNSGLKYLFLVIAILIAFSRLYLYVHYPTDILAGIVLGLFSGQMIAMLAENSGYPLAARRIFGQLIKLMG